MRKGYVYILANRPYGTLYVGVTSDVSARLEDRLAESVNPNWDDLEHTLN